MNALLKELKFDENDLIPAVAQDVDTGEVLMVAYMSRESLAKTIETGLAHYWSRSRKELWKKGESSGCVQEVKSIRVDCDGDTLLLKVKQKGGACHTGYKSCFYREFDSETGALKEIGKKIFNPEDVYKEKKGNSP